MQTFLPYGNFIRCAVVLDSQRLNKQLTECVQIYRAITDPSAGWQSHPAVNMWRGYQDALLEYGLILYAEWQRRFDAGERGGKRNHKSGEKLRAFFLSRMPPQYPPWLYDERLHASHRACLLAKNPDHYGQFGWTEPPALKKDGQPWPYFWPTKERQ